MWKMKDRSRKIEVAARCPLTFKVLMTKNLLNKKIFFI